jgi:sporulation protein YlmC with PRC-barrel domain
MRRLIIAATVFAVVGLMLTTGAFAQTGGTTTGQPGTTPTRPSETTPSMSPSTAGKEWHASRLIGADVKNQQGEALGEIEELVIDPQDAKIKAVVISGGGVLGLGAKRVSVPWNQVKPGADDDEFVIAMSKDEFQNAPSWERPAGAGRATGTRERTREPASPPASDRPATPGR